MKTDYTDPMSQFHGRKTSKIIKPGELIKSEWAEQLTFCKWLKHQHPNIRFRSDMQSAGKLSPQMQNIKLIIDPWRAWPDIQVYHRSGNFCGLMLEMKRLNSGTFLKDGSLSSGKHVQEQHEMNEFLRVLGWRVEFAEGFEEAKRIFEEYVAPPVAKKSRCCGMCNGIDDICVADMVCQEHSLTGCEICYGEI